MRNSSFVFFLEHIFQKCITIDLYCVLVVVLKKKLALLGFTLGSGLNFGPISEGFSGTGVLSYSRRLNFHQLNIRR